MNPSTDLCNKAQAMHKSAIGGHTGYAMVPGTDALRDTVARRTMERTGVRTTRDNVLITPGGQSALFAAHSAACDPGDTALFLDPYYATYPGTLRGVGAIPRAVQTRAEDAFQPRARDIEAAAAGARSLLINSPNNPTGTVYSQATLQGIADVCKAHDLWLISDEVYDSQIWEGAHISPRSLPGMAERAGDRVDVEKSRDDGLALRLGDRARGRDRAYDHLCHAHDLWGARLCPGCKRLCSGTGTGIRRRGGRAFSPPPFNCPKGARRGLVAQIS